MRRMPNIRLPNIRFSTPRVRLPRVRFPRIRWGFPRLAIPFRKIGIVIGAINSSILVLAGVLGIALTYINTPQIATVLHWMAPILPFRWENIFWTGAWVNVTDQLIFDTILAAQANFIPMLSVSIGLIVPNTFD